MVLKRRIAVYLGTFDPLTLGHYDVISRASHIFDELVVGIGKNYHKNPCFTPEERLHLTQAVCAPLTNVRAYLFSGLAVDFTRLHHATIMVRGLRTEGDYAYEMQMAMMNRVLDAKIETVFIPTRQELSHISSSLVKEVAALGGNISQLVPELVYAQLSGKFAGHQ